MNLHFIIGTGRCGSSYLHEILALHEDVSFISNVDDNLPALALKGRWNKALYSLTGGALTAKGRFRFAPSEAYHLIGREASTIYSYSCRDLFADDVTPWLRQRFTTCFEGRWRTQRRDCLLHKYTGWPRLGFFGEIFPKAHFIHVVRDGRAVANSYLQMNWWLGYHGPENWPWGRLPPTYEEIWEESGRSFVVLSGLLWKMLIEAYEGSTAVMPADRRVQVRYEDFLSDPKGMVRQLCEFLGLPWSTRFSRIVDRIRVDASRKNAFERDLTPQQLALLERYIGQTLGQLGYL